MIIFSWSNQYSEELYVKNHDIVRIRKILLCIKNSISCDSEILVFHEMFQDFIRCHKISWNAEWICYSLPACIDIPGQLATSLAGRPRMSPVFSAMGSNCKLQTNTVHSNQNFKFGANWELVVLYPLWITIQITVKKQLGQSKHRSRAIKSNKEPFISNTTVTHEANYWGEYTIEMLGVLPGIFWNKQDLFWNGSVYVRVRSA